MITTNRQYSLPHKDHVVLDDLEKIRAAFEMIDDDVSKTEEKIDDTIYIVSNLENRVVRAPAVVENSEIQNITPNRYVKITDDGNGFECVEGGGESGGKAGQCSIKKSEDNYDTIWGNILEVSPKGMTVYQNSGVCQSNETHIFADEIDETGEAALFPRADMVNQQIVEDTLAESNESFVLKNSIEQANESQDETVAASRYNYGFVKIGDGITDNGGEISADGYGFASKENYGLIKIGDGISNNDEEISIPTIEMASNSTFGVTKLGVDFSLNTNGEMEVIETISGEPVIYKLAKMKIIHNGIVDLEENIAVYRTFLNEDLQFSFNVGFEPQDDFSFILEIISDAEHMVSFDVMTLPSAFSPIGVNRGINRIKFTKLLGSQKWKAEASFLESPDPILLTPNNGDPVKSNLIVYSNGTTWNMYDMMGTDVGNLSFQNNPREVCFDFAKSAVVDYVYFYNNNGNALSLFELLGSNDKITWTRLLYKANTTIAKNTTTEKKGAYHYFKLRFSNEGNVRGIQLYGTTIDNNDSELILLTPSMGADTMGAITISCSNLKRNSLRDVTSPPIAAYTELDKGSHLEAWIQYEFATPKVANFLDMSAQTDELHRTARWFRLIASNDGNNWELLLEREYQEDWKQGETRYFDFENTTGYRFYRLVCSYTNDGSFLWRISRFRLFRRESGTSYFINSLPPLIAASQDGYEVSANSQSDSNNAAVYAFDGNSDTRWATAAGDQFNSWLKIKLPEAMACSAVYLQARNDNYYYQAPSAFKIQASDDGENWIDFIYESATWTQNEAKIFSWFNETPYLYYRLLIETVQSGNNAGLAKFGLGRRAKTYRRHLNKNDNVVPTMTSDSTTGADGTYVLSSSSEHSGHKRIYLFDRQFNTRFELNGEASGWVQVELPVAKFINFFAVGARDDSWCDAAPRDYSLLGSNDGTSWITLFSIENSPTFSRSELRTHELTHSAAYKFYRLNIGNSNRSPVLTFARWDLIIKELVIEY
ncbi:hypothetical protein FACS189449_09950 [Alphaproteobacteria bacterium]|nr:hypothetical protein FACS189449_09950 [Alphaproteobacteria bacterium]